VRYVLEGSCEGSGEQFRIAGGLIDAVTGAHIWAIRFERDLTDVFRASGRSDGRRCLSYSARIIQQIAMAARRRPENLTAYDFGSAHFSSLDLTTRRLAEATQAWLIALGAGPRVGRAASLCKASFH